MMTDDKFLQKRFTELAERAYASGRYIYSDFLGLNETDILMRMKKELQYAGLTLFGGTSDCERVVARFGDCGYDETYPITCLSASPLQQKFADRLTHRDILGALMNLGIERDLIGDIYIKDNVAYFFCISRVAPVIISDFTNAKHTTLVCREVDALPDGTGTEPQEERIQITSERADVIVAATYDLSREESLEVFREGKVFIDGRQCENNSAAVKPGTVVSVRGYGRFRYLGYENLSRKGKLNAKIEKWV